MISILDYIKDLSRELGSIRQAIHAFPELGFEEHETSKLIQNYLSNIKGVEVTAGIAGTGVVAIIQGKEPGPCVAFRADMDALPIVETSGKIYESKRPGIMHACGHDGHTTILLGLAKVLAEYRDQLKGSVKLIFQPAEEFGAGAKVMVEQGALENPKVDVIFGIHGWPHLELGNYACAAGAFFAGVTDFEIKFKGAGGHAAFPEHCKDPLLPAAKVFTRLKQEIALGENYRLGLAAFNGGSFYNIIPSECKILGTLRFFDFGTRDEILRQLDLICKSESQKSGVDYEIIHPGVTYPPLFNTARSCEYVNEVLQDTAMQGQHSGFPVYAAEDFAFYLEKVPGAFILLGLKSDYTEKYPELHSSNFDFADPAIYWGILTFTQIALNYSSTS